MRSRTLPWIVAIAIYQGACTSSGAAVDAGTNDAAYLSPGVDEVRLGIIDFFGESEDVLGAPEVVAARATFTLSIATYGGGCEEPYSLEVAATAAEIVLTPYDRSYRPADTPEAAEVCTAILRRLPHRTKARFDSPGVKTLRVRGRGARTFVDIEVEIVRPIVVE